MLVRINITTRWRWGFFWSALLHCGVVSVIALVPARVATPRHPLSTNRRYSVLVLRLEDFRPTRKSAGSQESGRGPQVAASGSKPSPGGGESPQGPPAQLRAFVLPPVARRDPVKQTLVQFDVPPEIQLKQEIPLPTALLWDQLPPVRRKFVAPATREKRPVVMDVPPAPELLAPNRELATADLKLAAVITNQNPRLVRPPARTAPLSGAARQALAEPPQIAPLDSTDAGVTALISQPAVPVMSARTFAVPPANQVAASGNGGGNGGDADSLARQGDGTGRSSKGTTGTAQGTTSQGGGQGAGQGGGQGGGMSGTNSAAAAAGPGASGAGTGIGASAGLRAGANGAAVGLGSGDSGNRVDPNARPDLPMAGTTRFTLPANGKFSVIVTGSSVAAPYAESAGAMSGKMIYSVYISVGLRKKWILEYCLPKAEEQKITVKGRVQSIDAPWPYVIDRPDNIGVSSGEYVLVHGTLTTEGRFEQLALVFPVELQKKDLLMNALKRWTFRPANRDGVPTAVEVLLIIPSQSE